MMLLLVVVASSGNKKKVGVRSFWLSCTITELILRMVELFEADMVRITPNRFVRSDGSTVELLQFFLRALSKDNTLFHRAT